MNSSQGSGSSSLLLAGSCGVALRFGENTSLGEENNVFVGKLLLELSGKPGISAKPLKEGQKGREVGLKRPSVNLLILTISPSFLLTSAGQCGRP